MRYNHVVRAAMLLAVTICAQSLRFFVPLPPLFSSLLVGTLVNACLLTTVALAGWRAAAGIAVLAPVVAFMQQMMPLPVLVVPIAIGNILYLWSFYHWTQLHWLLRIALSAVLKAGFLYASIVGIAGFYQLPGSLTTVMLAAFGWLQVVTGSAGGLLSYALIARLKKSRYCI